MAENQNEAVEPQVEEQEQTVEQPVEEVKPEAPITKADDGVIKVDLSKLNNQENAVQEQSTDESNVTLGQPEDTPSSEEVVEEVRDTEQEEVILEEIPNETTETNNTDEGGVAAIAEATDTTPEQEEVLQEDQTQAQLPEGLEKVVDFLNETGGSLQDYVKLNTDYSQLNEKQLLREYYQNTRPHLEPEEISFLMEDNFSFDEEIDEERAIKKKKIAYKEELAKAKNHLDTLKSKYYQEIKSGSRLNPDQQKAVEFFNRYKKENEEATKLAEKQSAVFNKQTENVFNKNFKGFDFNVGDKKFRFNVKDAEQIKTTQSDINNFVKKFLNDNNEMSDAAGYHKSLFTAMNADKIANHFYEQGKADAIKDSMAKAKNIDMEPRGSHEEVSAPNGWKVRSIGGQSTSKLKIKNTIKKK